MSRIQLPYGEVTDKNKKTAKLGLPKKLSRK